MDAPSFQAQTQEEQQLERPSNAQPYATTLIAQTTDDLPSYRLRRDVKESGAFAFHEKRGSAGSNFSRSLISLRGDAIPGKIPARRRSSEYFRPLVTAVTMANLKAINNDKQESQHEAMVQHFQLRRLRTSNTQMEPPNVSSNDSNEHDPIAKGAPVDGEPDLLDTNHDPSMQKPSSQSSLLETRRKSVSHVQLSRAISSVVNDFAKPGSIHSIEARSIAKFGGPASHEARFSLSRRLKGWRRRVISKWRRAVAQLSAPMAPFSTASQVRALLLLMACMWNLTYKPLKLAFALSDSAWGAYVEISLELLFIADFLLGFNTSFVDKSGEMVVSRKTIAWNYLRGWCLPDLLSSIPIGTISYVRHGHANAQDLVVSGGIQIERFVHIMLAIRVLWFAHARRARKGYSAWFLYSRYTHLHRIAWVLLWIVYIAHLVACGWKLLESTEAACPATLAEDYAAIFYDALQLLQGQGLATNSLGQNIFASFAVLIGSIVLAVVFGHVAMLVSNFNANSTNYQRKMETVFAVMTKLQLPVLLRDRIHQYYEHLWREYESLDGQRILFSKELTHTLELEVLLFKYMAVIMHVPFCHEATPDFLKQIVLCVQVRVYLPDDYVIRRGEIGDEYYIINRGYCELLTGADSIERASVPLSTTKRQGSFRNSIIFEDPAEITLEVTESDLSNTRSKAYRTVRPMGSNGNLNSNITKLSCGQSFGEMALIMNYQRTADARALTYVEMCVLKREQFQKILIRYPEDRKLVMTKILTNTMVNNDHQSVLCPLKNLVRSIFGSSADDKSITAKQAAALIIEVINPERDDESLKFGIDLKLRQRLTTLHEQQKHLSHYYPGSERMLSVSSLVAGRLEESNTTMPVAREAQTNKTATPAATEFNGQSPGPSARYLALEARIAKVESSHIEILRVVQQMHAAMIEIKENQDKILSLPCGAAPRASTTPRETSSVAVDLQPMEMPSSCVNMPVRRIVSAPSSSPEATTSAGNVNTSSANRRSTEMAVSFAGPSSRGLRPMLRRMSSIIGIYAKFIPQDPAPSASRYADELFLSCHHTQKTSRVSSSVRHGDPERMTLKSEDIEIAAEIDARQACHRAHDGGAGLWRPHDRDAEAHEEAQAQRIAELRQTLQTMKKICGHSWLVNSAPASGQSHARIWFLFKYAFLLESH